MAIFLRYYIGRKQNWKTLSPFYFHFGAYAHSVIHTGNGNIENSTAGGTSHNFVFRTKESFPEVWELDEDFRTGGMTTSRILGNLELSIATDEPDFFMKYTFEMHRIDSCGYHCRSLAVADTADALISYTPAKTFYYEASISGVMRKIDVATSGRLVEKEYAPPGSADAMFEYNGGQQFDLNDYDDYIHADNIKEEPFDVTMVNEESMEDEVKLDLE